MPDYYVGFTKALRREPVERAPGYINGYELEALQAEATTAVGTFLSRLGLSVKTNVLEAMLTTTEPLAPELLSRIEQEVFSTFRRVTWDGKDQGPMPLLIREQPSQMVTGQPAYR